MNRSTLRIIIAILTLITAAIHFYMGFRSLGDTLGILFLLNGVGYLALLAAFWLDIPKGRASLVRMALMAFAAVTFVAYFVVNRGFSFQNTIGLVTKLDELLLIVALYLYGRSK